MFDVSFNRAQPRGQGIESHLGCQSAEAPRVPEPWMERQGPEKALVVGERRGRWVMGSSGHKETGRG